MSRGPIRPSLPWCLSLLTLVQSLTICLDSSAEERAATSDDGPIAVVVVPGSLVDPERARAAIEAELREPVVLDTDPRAQNARGVLIIAPYRGRQHLFVYGSESSSSGRLWRTLELEEDPDAALESIAFLAGNLVRDQIGDFIEDLVPPQPEPEPEPTPEPEPEPVTEPQCPQCPPEPEPLIVAARRSSYEDNWQVGLAAVEVFSEATPSTRIELGAAYRFRFLSVGISANVNTFPACEGFECASLLNASFQAEVAYRRSFRWAIAEIGLAGGLRFHHLSNRSEEALAATPLGRLQLTLAIPVGRVIDAFVRSEVGSTFIEPDLPERDIQPPSSLWEIAIGAGLRAHF